MTQPRCCPACGTIVPTRSGFAGLCPACAWKGLLEEEELEIREEGHPGSSVGKLEEGSVTAAAGLKECAEGPAPKNLMRLPGYQVLEEISRGGMGIVYRARQVDPARTVALKMLLPHQLGSPEMAERFRLEVRALTELDHPAILPVYQVGEQDRLPFFTMKLATGGTLAQRKAEFAGNWQRIAELVATLADAVHFAHEHGVLHRDVKPGNVLFDDAGRPYVSDFGLAKLLGAETDLTRSADFLGTPHYVAPEVAERSARQATTASDIYSLGAVLYELLAGRPPFEAEGLPGLLKKITEEEPARPPGVPRDLEVICLKCLAKNPKARYATARELAEDLRRWLAGRTILARPATRLERVRSWARRNPALATAAGLVMLASGVAILLQAQANRRLKGTLAESRLSQARLQRSTGRAGQRFQTISLIAEATKLWSAAHPIPRPSTAAMLASLRTELAGALALPDVRPLARWPVPITHFENDFGFTANLDRYVAASAEGGFTVFSINPHEAIWQFKGATNNPAVEMRLSPNGHWVAANFQDGHLELHSTSLPASTPSSVGRESHRTAGTLGLSMSWEGLRNARANIAFAPLGNRMAAASIGVGEGGYVEVIDLESRRVEAQLPAGDARTMAFNPEESHLAVGGKELAVWRVADTNRLWSSTLSHHASALAWSPDGHWLAVALDHTLSKGSEAFTGNPVLLFDAATGRQHRKLAETGTRIEWLAFHPDGSSVVAATWQSELVWISLESEGFRLAIPGAQRGLSFAPDGKRLAYAPSRQELGLLEVATPSALRQWRATSPPARQSFTLAVSTDGRWAAAGTADDVRLWDIEARAEVANQPLPASPWWVTVLFGPGDNSLYYSGASFGVRCVELARTNGSDGRIRINFGPERSVSATNGLTALGFAADHRSLIVGQNSRRAQNERIAPTIWLWPEADPTRARKLAENFPMIGYRALPGGKWGVSTDLIEPDLWIWDFETGQRGQRLGISLPVNSEPTPDGRWLVTRTRAEFAVWEVGTWRQIAKWPAQPTEQETSWLVISPDSRLLVTPAIDGRLTLRSLPSGVEVMALPLPQAMPLADWRFSPDGKRLLVLANTGHLFEWDLGEIRRELAKVGLDWESASLR